MSEEEKKNGAGHRPGTGNLMPPWPKGVSGNPKGSTPNRPFRQALLEIAKRECPPEIYEKIAHLKGRPQIDALAEIAFRRALKGDVRLIEFCVERIDGKVALKIEGGDNPIMHEHRLDMTRLNGEELNALERIVNKSRIIDIAPADAGGN